MSYTTMTTDAYYQIDGRINDADRTYGCPSSAHEMLGVIAEEYAELIEAVRSGKSGGVEWEALDLAAACIRLAYACEQAMEPFAKRSGFLDARETSPQKGLPL